MVRVDLIVSVIVAAFGSPFVVALFQAVRSSWRERRDVETTAQKYRRLAAAWEATCWETRLLASRHGVPQSDFPLGPGEGPQGPAVTLPAPGPPAPGDGGPPQGASPQLR